MTLFFFFFFFFSLILYFWKSNLYSRFLLLLFGICYQFCTFKNPIFSTHFYLKARLLAWLLSPLLDSPFFSTRLPWSPPSPFSSLPNSVNLCVFQTVENTYGTDYWLDLSLSLFIPLFYPPGHLCLLPPSSLLCTTPWTSLSRPVMECT